MKESQGPMIPRKMELDKNPHGTELKISQQKELEKTGRYVAIRSFGWDIFNSVP